MKDSLLKRPRTSVVYGDPSSELWCRNLGCDEVLEGEKLQVEAGRKLLRVSVKCRTQLSVESLAGGQCEPKGTSNV